jgi:multiple sugar transport system substrate-binding protein
MTVKDENGKIKTAGAAIGTFDNIDHASDILSMLLLQNGVDFKNLSASSDRFNGTLSFYTSFATDQNNVWDNTLDPSTLAFSKGNLAMYFGYSWDYFNIKKFNPNLNFEVVPVPQLPDRTVNMASYWVEGVSSKSKSQKQAFLFMKFLVKKETEEKLYAEESKERAFGEPYARVDLSDTLKSNPNVYTFISQAKTASSTLFVDKTYDNGLNQQLNTYLGNAVNSVLSNGSTQSAFDAFLKGVLQILQKYGQ